jgi:hypothetical protein
MERIVQARKNLSDIETLGKFAARYINLGWSPVALEANNDTDLGVDFGQPQMMWLESLMDLTLQETSLNLALRLEPDSQLFVLKVHPALGQSLLDRLENWRSPCAARAGNTWEHHFYLLPKSWGFAPKHPGFNKNSPLSFLGPGNLVTVPPSVELANCEVWQWLYPPWEQAPCHPGPELLTMLEDIGFISKASLSEEDLPSWKEIYPVICHSNKLLQALLVPEKSSVLYYRKILFEALRAGFRDPGLLQGLLWHAPFSEGRLESKGQSQFSQWASIIREILSREQLSTQIRGSSDWGGCLSAPTAPAYKIDAATQNAPASSIFGKRPDGAFTPASAEDLENDLYFLATETKNPEEVPDKPECLYLSPESSSGCSSHSSRHRMDALEDPLLEKKMKKLEELRQAVDECLAAIQSLPDPN